MAIFEKQVNVQCGISSISILISSHIHNAANCIIAKNSWFQVANSRSICQQHWYFLWQWCKLPQTTYHCRYRYRYSEARIKWVKIQNSYVVRCIKSVFSKLALLLRVWQRNFFTKLERRVKQRSSPFKKNSQFKTQVTSF